MGQAHEEVAQQIDRLDAVVWTARQFLQRLRSPLQQKRLRNDDQIQPQEESVPHGHHVAVDLTSNLIQ